MSDLKGLLKIGLLGAALFTFSCTGGGGDDNENNEQTPVINNYYTTNYIGQNTTTTTDQTTTNSTTDQTSTDNNQTTQTSTDNNQTTQTTKTLEGSLVVPADRAVIAVRARAVNATNCPNVPVGYVPVANAEIEILNRDTNQLATITRTDACGIFMASVPYGTYILNVEWGNRTFTIPEEALNATNGTVSLPDPTTTRYEVSIVDLDLNKNRFVITVNDKTGKPVLGVPVTAVKTHIKNLNKNYTIPLVVEYWIASVVAQDNTTAILFVLDASGSMSDIIDYTNYKDKYAYTAESVRYIIGGLTNNTFSAFEIFDDKVDFINGPFINSLGITDRNGTPVTIDYPEDGFTNDRDKLNFVVDLYNPNSPLYDYAASFYPYYLSVYRWGGGTALLDAVCQGIEILSQYNATRKYMVVVTDGYENSSYHYCSSSNYTTSVPLYLNGTDIHIYTIGIGDNNTIDALLLQNLAQLGGGKFYQVIPSQNNTGIDIIDTFVTVYTNIQFQYIGVYAPVLLESGYNYTFTVEVNYLGISGNATYNFTY